MIRLAAFTTVLALAGCSSVPTAPSTAGSPAGKSFSGNAARAAVGARMVDDVSTVVRLDPLTHQSQVEGVRSQFVYKGLLGAEGAKRTTIVVRYEEHRIVDGVEKEVADYLADVQLDLAQGNVLTLRGWQIAVVEANDRSIEYVAVRNPPPP